MPPFNGVLSRATKNLAISCNPIRLSRLISCSQMSSISTKRRGRPSKYASKDEKKEVDAKRRRVQRKTASAIEREALFD